MKKLITALLLTLISVVGYSQVPVRETSPSSFTNQIQRLLVIKNFNLPKSVSIPTGTPTSINSGADSIGAEVYCLADSNTYVYTGNGVWISTGKKYSDRSTHTGTQLASTISDLASYTGLDGRYYTETEIANIFAGTTPISGYNKTTWDAALSSSSLTGIADYVARFTGTTTLSTGKIRDNGTTVGINTAPSASYLMSVVGGLPTLLKSDSEAVLRAENTNGNYLSLVVGAGSSLAAGQVGMAMNGANIWSYTGAIFRFHNSNIATANSLGTFIMTGGFGSTNLGNSIRLSSNTTNAGQFTAASGTQNTVTIGSYSNETWAPSSGSATYNLLNVNPIINTTGSYSGIIRGYYFNPTLTSTTGATIRAFESAAGNWVIGGSGTLTVGGLSAGSAGNFVVNGGSGLLVTRTPAQALIDLNALSIADTAAMLSAYNLQRVTTLGNKTSNNIALGSFSGLAAQADANISLHNSSINPAIAFQKQDGTVFWVSADSNFLYIGGQGSLQPNNSSLRIQTGTQHIYIQNQPNQTTNADSFLVKQNNVMKYQTAAQVAASLNLVDTLNRPLHRRDYQNTTPIFNLPGKKAVFFGHSIPAGSGASGTPPSPNRYSTIFCRLTGMTEVNLAVSGMFMSKQAPLSSMGAKFAVDSMTYLPVWDTSYALMVIDLGVNDLLFNGTYFTPENFKAAGDSIMTYLVNVNQWPRERIVILGPSYVSYTGRAYAETIYNTYPTWQGMASAQREDDYVQAAVDISTKWGTLYANMNKIFTMGGDSLWLVHGEGIHPNDTGHLMMAQYLYEVTVGNTWKIPSLLVNGLANFDSAVVLKPINSIPAPAPNAVLAYTSNASGTVRLADRTIISRGNGWIWQNESGISQAMLNDTGLVIPYTSRLDSIAPRKRLDVRGSTVIDDSLQVGKIPALATTSSRVLVHVPGDSIVRYRPPAQILSDAGGVAGSFTSGRVPRATGTNTLADGVIQDNGTNVGIGTAPNTYPLNVNSGTSAGSMSGGGNLLISSTMGNIAFGSRSSNASDGIVTPTATNGEIIFAYYTGATNAERYFFPASGNMTAVGTVQSLGFIAETSVSSAVATPGSFNYESTAGSYIKAKTGSLTDYQLYTPSGSTVYSVPTGTQNVRYTGGLRYKYRAVTTTASVNGEDYTVDCTSGTFTVTLPTAVGREGQVFVVKNSGGGTITLDGDGSETIDGSATQPLATNVSYMVQSTGTGWIIIAKS